MKLRFVTPEKTIFSERDVKEIILPTESGEITVLPNHAALVSLISAGIVQIVPASPNGAKDNKEYFY
jgi:F-type H+-transporting ATPase subunit epsilon